MTHKSAVVRWELTFREGVWLDHVQECVDHVEEGTHWPRLVTCRRLIDCGGDGPKLQSFRVSLLCDGLELTRYGPPAKEEK